MEEIRCIKCGRPLGTPRVLLAAWVPNVPAPMAVIETDTVRGVCSYGAAVTPTLFTLVGEGKSIEELPTVEEVLSRTDALAPNPDAVPNRFYRSGIVRSRGWCDYISN